MDRVQAQEQVNQWYRDYHHTFGDPVGIRVLADVIQFTSLLERDDPVSPDYALGKQDVVRFILERMGYAEDVEKAVEALLSRRPSVPMLPDIEIDED